MKKALKYLIMLALSLLTAMASAAQGLPAAPRDKSVKSGILPNGMSYYLVANPTTDNLADFALVQRTGLNEIGEKSKTIAREALASLPRFQESPQAFLALHGVAPSKDGFVKVSENSTLYHFNDIILTEHSIDSVLLVLMDIADRGTHQEDSVWKWYTPEDHAVIVSGDIDTTELASKLQMLSYMIPARPSQQRAVTPWQSRAEPIYESNVGAVGQIVTISAMWEAPRIPQEYMGTIQPAIYTMFLNELGILAKERITQRFRHENIPVADVSYEHLSSLRTLGSENFVVRVSLSPEYLLKGIEVLASTMSSLDEGSATVPEFEMAKRRYLDHLEKRAQTRIRSNDNYVKYCASAFLYGAPLSTSREIYSFLRYRSIDVTTELKHFNNIASALLDGERNLTVSCVTPEDFTFSSDQLHRSFKAAWDSDAFGFECKMPIDSLPLPSTAEPIKVKKIKKDPMSGGVVWIFENGFQVVYKKQETDRRMLFSLALNGGYGNIRGLSSGEGAYVSDYLNLSKVCGIPFNEFTLALEEKDISLNATVNMSNTIIDGSAPESELELMMRTIGAVVNEREYDPAAFEYYKSCQNIVQEMMTGSVRDRIVAIDSLMCPEYEYSSLKTSGKITEDFPSKVEAFWAHQAGKTNDGALILIGNVDETQLRKMLQNHIGNFRTTNRVYPRLNVNYQPISGSIAYTFKGEQNSVDIALSSRLSLTAENYMASNIAASVLKQIISKAIDGTGTYLRLAHDCRIYPQERFNLMITLEDADPQGFSSDVQLTGSKEALAILRKVLTNLPNMEISDEDLEKYKNVLKGHTALKVSDPQYWIHALAMRYLDGKDLTTSYESRIDGVTAEKVKSILASLANASRVEYIIEK